MPAVVENIGSALGIRRGEYVKAVSLFGYLLFVIASYTVSKTVRDALFLSEFGALKLPYVYIGIAALVGIFVSIYIRLARRIRHDRLLLLTLAFFASNVLLFWWLLRLQVGWLYPVIYIWAGIFGVIAPMQVWTLSNFVFTTRQAKRLYGFLGAGGVLGGIAGGFFSSRMVPMLGTENLLLGIAVFLAISMFLVKLLWSRSHSTARVLEAPRNDAPGGLWQAVGIIRRSRYLVLIAAIISVGSLVTTVVDYQFKAVAGDAIGSKDQLTVFFGNFYGYLGILAFVLQILLTSRLMRRLGIGFTILLLPVGLLLGSTLLLIYGTLWAAVLLKSPDQLFKHSIDKSTVELLYLPVPASVKPAVKSFVDTVVWRLADGSAGVVVLFLTSVLALNTRQVSIPTIALILGWIVLAYFAKRHYLDALRAAISRREVDTARTEVGAQELSTPSLMQALRSADDEEVYYVLTLIKSMGVSREMVTHLEPLMEHPSRRVRAKVLDVLCEVGNERLAVKAAKLLDDESGEVQAKAIHFLRAHGRGQPFTKMLAFLGDANYRVRGAAVSWALNRRNYAGYHILARRALAQMLHSRSQRARKEAARALRGIRASGSLHDAIAELLRDASSEVVEQALRTAGEIARPEFVPLIIPHLNHSRTRAAARDALARYGPPVLPDLARFLDDSTLDLETRIAIPQAISRIAVQESVDVLAARLQERNPRLRLAIVKGLNRLCQSGRWDLPHERVEEQLLDEVRQYYQNLRLVQVFYSPVQDDTTAAEGAQSLLEMLLQDRLEQLLERIFRLMGLLYSPEDLDRAHQGLACSDSAIRDNAIELLDNLLRSEHRAFVLPVLDDETPLSRKLEAGRALGIEPCETVEEALEELLASEDPLVLICAMDAMEALRLDPFEHRIRALGHHPDHMVRETAECLLTRWDMARAA